MGAGSDDEQGVSSEAPRGRHKGRVLHDTFVLDEVLGEGGMGVVYVAHNAKTPTIKYAVKLLHRNTAIDTQRFRREAQALAALEHPAIVRPVHVDVTDEGEPYLVMEFVRGTPLREKLARSGAGRGLDRRVVLEVLEGIADALDHAHARGVIHRDLKPENVLVLEGGRRVLVKVLDFGIAKIIAPDGTPADTLTQTREVAGTVAYMSPEQCREMRTAGPASDRFTLGVMAYELLCGRRPFDGPNAPSTVANILLNPLPTEPFERAGLDPSVLGLLQRACAKSPDERFESACAFVEALAARLDASLSRASSSSQALEGGVIDSAVRTPTQQIDATMPAQSSDRLVKSAGAGQHFQASSTSPASAPLERTMAPAVSRARGLAGTVLVVVAGAGLAAGISVVRARRPRAVATVEPTAPQPVAPPRCAGAARVATAGLFDEERCIRAARGPIGSEARAGEPDEYPRHEVALEPFFLDRHEVTVARFRRCVLAGACDASGLDRPRSAEFARAPRGAACTYRREAGPDDALPVTCVTHAQATQLCRFEGKRLPTEAEWERAARGADDRAYPWGSAAPTCALARFDGEGTCRLAGPAPVGTAPDGATPDGVFDLAGNVAEWTADWYAAHAYEDPSARTGTGPTLERARADAPMAPCRDGCRVVRGGGFGTLAARASLLRSAAREAVAPVERAQDLGFRCARTP